MFIYIYITVVITGLKRLALPVCLLTEAGQSHTRTAKRLASSPKCGSAKRRCVDAVLQVCVCAYTADNFLCSWCL